jgi:hypothetical protein
MPLQVITNARSATKPLPALWRRSAFVLLFIFVWDIGFELLAPLHFDPETSLPSVSVIDPAETEYHPDCGFPDHECALSHHHHFPALVSAGHSIVFSVATEPLPATPPVTARYRDAATRLIRGPPSSPPFQHFI